MLQQIALPALRVTAVTLFLTGLVYPLACVPIAQLLFPQRASGSLIFDDRGEVIGSALIGQRFASPHYFQGRPSAAGTDGYDASASSGSNFGPTSQRLQRWVQSDLTRLQADNPDQHQAIPVELLTASASGLDPHLSPHATLWQVPRVAKARGLSEDRVAALIAELQEGRDLGIFGEPRVNVLLLNVALDRRFGRLVAVGP